MSGFTLIEVLLVVAIFIILAAGVTTLSGNWLTSAQVDNQARQIASTIRLARTRSESGFNNSKHGVYFDNVPGGRFKYVLFQGDTYIARDQSYDQEIELPQVVFMENDLSGNEIVFSEGFGIPIATGTVTVGDTAGMMSKTITINVIGAVDVD